VQQPDKRVTIVAHQENVYLEELVVYQRFAAVRGRQDGSPQVLM